MGLTINIEIAKIIATNDLEFISIKGIAIPIVVLSISNIKLFVIEEIFSLEKKSIFLFK